MREATNLPLYEEIARDLLGAIEVGDHAIGSLLPPEIELAGRYRVSRQTIRMAMRRLTEIGAVTRRAGAGTRVEARKAASGSFQWTLASLADLTHLASMTTREVVAIRPLVLDRQQGRELEAPPGTHWLHMSYIRRENTDGNPPMGWVDVFLDAKYAGVLDGIGGSPVLICDLVERRFGTYVSEVRQEVSVTGLPESMAGALDAAAGMPALRVMRRYYDQRGALFEISVSTHPQGRYAISSTLKRSREGN